MGIKNFPKSRQAAILGLIRPEVAPFNVRNYLVHSVNGRDFIKMDVNSGINWIFVLTRSNDDWWCWWWQASHILELNSQTYPGEGGSTPPHGIQLSQIVWGCNVNPSCKHIFVHSELQNRI